MEFKQTLKETNFFNIKLKSITFRYKLADKTVMQLCHVTNRKSMLRRLTVLNLIKKLQLSCRVKTVTETCFFV